jgi:TPR repeat protein
VEKDYAQAVNWFRKAAIAGDEWALKKLKGLETGKQSYGFHKGRKVEIEKFRPDPLPSCIQAVTSDGPNFYRTPLIPDSLTC